jgi:hypothetical protein
MANKFLKQPQNTQGHLDDEELDAVRALLVSFLIKKTPLDSDDIYSYIFGEGKRIIWN